MPTFYETLGVNKHATQAQITEEYSRRMQQLQPGMENEAKKLKESFEVLSSPDKRVAYDIDYFGFDAYMQRFTAQGVKVTALDNPDKFNHYDYMNKLYGWNEQDKLIPGQVIYYDNLWEKLSYASTMLESEESKIHAALDMLKNKRLKENQKLEQRLNMLKANIDKIEIIRYVLLLPNVKRLYDLTLGIYDNTQELKEVERLIGGKQRLIEWFRKYPKLHFGRSLFTLQQKNLLTSKNIGLLITHEPIGAELYSIFNYLLKTDLLIQKNFDAVIEHAQYALKLAMGMGSLKTGKAATQEIFMDMLNAKQDAYNVAEAFKTLNMDGILTSENYAAILRKPPQTANHIHLFNDMWKKKEFLQEDKAALMWIGSGAERMLSQRINEMFAHGLILVDIDVEKGKTAILLAFALKKKLKDFFTKSADEQRKLKDVFKYDFIKLLHSKDREMAKTQDGQYWKIIIKNILIALTGIGLFAIGINYLVNNRLLFSQTRREKNIQTVEEVFYAQCKCI